MQAYACLFVVVLLIVVHARCQRRAFHHPEEPGSQLAYRTTRWLIALAILWWMAVITPRVADRYLPDEIMTGTSVPVVSNESTTDFLFPPLPSWSDKH